jgi:hypothetical protein
VGIRLPEGMKIHKEERIGSILRLEVEHTEGEVYHVMRYLEGRYEGCRYKIRNLGSNYERGRLSGSDPLSKSESDLGSSKLVVEVEY